MVITWRFLAGFVVSLGITIAMDYLRHETEELDELTWHACVNPGARI
jgi:hypothetical protein